MFVLVFACTCILGCKLYRYFEMLSNFNLHLCTCSGNILVLYLPFEGGYLNESAGFFWVFFVCLFLILSYLFDLTKYKKKKTYLLMLARGNNWNKMSKNSTFLCCFLKSSYFSLAVLGLRCCVGSSLVVMSGGYSPWWRAGFSPQCPLLLLGMGSGARASVVAARGLSSCGSWALEHRLSTCGARA